MAQKPNKWLGLILGIVTGLVIVFFMAHRSFGQSAPQAPASWIEFQKDETAKRIAFFQQMKADRDAFLSAHPEAKAYLDQMHAAAVARMAAWQAAHQNKT